MLSPGRLNKDFVILLEILLKILTIVVCVNNSVAIKKGKSDGIIV